MNTLIEAINLWGDRFLAFAGPMLWQSSLLIAIVFTVERLLQKKLRAAVRYTLWLVVLVKLLLPPTLALPTGLAWWVRSTPVLAAPPANVPVQLVMTSDQSMPPMEAPALALPPPLISESQPLPPAPPAPPLPTVTLSFAGWIMLGAALISSGLLTWMLWRWYHAARDVRAAQSAPPPLLELLAEARRNLNLRRPVRLRLTDQPMSPVVCGLFRPTIFLPCSLAGQLSPHQMRAVLLHELIHLRRGDVWVNCAQALLQVFYWWHPLVWFANARLRRVREEAVDDAVMIALSDDAEAYAPTLLEVAKLAFHRPLASLGLVGILESRSALRQRIERLVEFHPPRTAGLTLASLLPVIAFGALAMPMGQAPLSTSTSSSSPTPSALATPVTEVLPATTESTSKRSDELLLAANAVEPIKEAKTLPVQNPSSSSNSPAVKPTVSHQDRQKIVSQLDRIRLNEVSYLRRPLREILADLSQAAKENDPDHIGVTLRINPGRGTSAEPAIDPSTGLFVSSDGQDISSLALTINPPLTNARLGEVLNVLVQSAPTPLRYAVSAEAIVFSSGKPVETLFIRTFKVNPNMLYRAMETATGGTTWASPLPDKGKEVQAVNTALRTYFTTLGVKLDLEAGETFFWNDRAEQLLVRSTAANLDMIEAAIQMLNAMPPQVHIKARFVEITAADNRALGLNQLLGNIPALEYTNVLETGSLRDFTSKAPRTSTNALNLGSAAAQITGILTDPQYRVLLRALEQNRDVTTLALPEVITVSGRQAQVQIAEVRTIVNGINLKSLKPGDSPTNAPAGYPYQTESMPFGPTLDIIPYVMPDGMTIQMTVIPSVTEFVGYDDPGKFAPQLNEKGGKSTAVLPLPRFRVRQMTTSVNVMDGQTIILAGTVSEEVVRVKDRVPVLGSIPLLGRMFRHESTQTRLKNLLVFVTPTILDPAGNRVHADTTRAAAQNGVKWVAPGHPSNSKPAK